MNGLTLRISGNIKNKRKAAGTADIGAIRFPDEITESLLKTSIKIDDFINATTANEQLTALAKVINNQKGTEGCYHYQEFVKILVEIYFYSQMSHPLKSFLSRHVEKQESLLTPFVIEFADKLREEISRLLLRASYNDYIVVIGNIISCTDCKSIKSTLKLIGTVVLDFLSNSLHFCCSSLRSENISPTDKNKMYQLAHTTIRATLHMIQNTEPNDIDHVMTIYSNLKDDLIHLFQNVEVPMDTKSLSGILYLHFYTLRNGPQSWTDICIEDFKDMSVECWLDLDKDVMDLILYSAIAVVVPVDQLEATVVAGKPAVLLVTDKIVALGERNIQECSFILGVARTVVQLCGFLNRIQDGGLSVSLCELYQRFVWTHVDHHLDSVRYLTSEALTVIVRFCAGFYKKGQPSALDSLLQSIINLTSARKAYFLALTELVKAVGTASVLGKVPDLIDQLILALDVQHVKASAATTLEALLDNDYVHHEAHMFQQWIAPILRHISVTELDQAAGKVLGNILAKILTRGNHVVQFILPKITSSSFISENTKLSAGDLKCVLVLLTVARKAGALPDQVQEFCAADWKHLMDYAVIRNAALNPCDQIRLQSLYLIVETQKSTELIVKPDFSFMLHYLKHNMNTQSSTFRQQMLSYVQKFFKRIEDTYKVLIKSSQEMHKPFKCGVEKFVEDFREMCFDSLLAGANYSRRYVCLQGLLWTELIALDTYTRVWKEEYVHKLVDHLDDSYECNKANALDILLHCPNQLLLSSNIMSMESIYSQASAIKPTACVSAAYKLRLINKKLPQLLLDERYSDITMSEKPAYCLINKLMDQLRKELKIAQKSVLLAASHAPMYGILHCICQLVKDLDYNSIAKSDEWSELVADLIQICMMVNQTVGSVVNSSSPEGHLPMDFEPGAWHLPNAMEEAECATASTMTAQRVLLCAWRSVKEVSLLLGEISNTLVIKEESPTGEGNLSESQVLSIGAHFTTLLTETKHRGAFEQAYVGFTKLLHRLWRSKVPTLHSVPSRWITELLDIISLGQSKEKGLCGTRRSAGLPFMIQALVTVEVQVAYAPVCFPACMRTLLRLAQEEGSGCPAAVEATVHSLNILRALFRHTSLSNAVSKYIESGMITAIKGFSRSTWAERNSATLLLSALLVRVFGVVRARGPALSLRNRMTGRIFFLRYPNMYHFMLTELQSAGCGDPAPRPALFPVLLLLARLYPSALEGTATTFRLSAYVSRVSGCAGSSSLYIRRLAAAAIVPLISHDTYLSHLQQMFAAVTNPSVKSNYCHGTLMMIKKLLENKPEDLAIDRECESNMREVLSKTLWLLPSARSAAPCYLIIDEYLHAINLILWKFPSFINEDLLNKIKHEINIMIFDKKPTFCHPARQVCISNGLYLYLIILLKQNDNKLIEIIITSLKHYSYELQLSVLNLILILHAALDKDQYNNYHKHWDEIINKSILTELQNKEEYVKVLCDLFKNSKYMECTQKSLLILSLEDSLERNIVEIKCQKNKMADDEIISKYIECVETEHENLTEIYLNCLLKFVRRKLINKDCNIRILDVIRTMHSCSSSENNERTRFVIVKFLEQNCFKILDMEFTELNLNEKFELRATMFVILSMLLEDDDPTVRGAAAGLVARSCGLHRAGETLCDYVTSEGHAGETLCDDVTSEGHAGETLCDDVTSEGHAGETLCDDVTSEGHAGETLCDYVTSEGHAGETLCDEVTSEGHAEETLCDDFTNEGHAGEALWDTVTSEGRAGETLRAAISRGVAAEAVLLVIALADFDTQVCLTEHAQEESRVFDQNEKYNVFMEESILSRHCIRTLQRMHKPTAREPTLRDRVTSLLNHPVYKDTFVKLCDNNLKPFNDLLLSNGNVTLTGIVNPKVQVIFDCLS